MIIKFIPIWIALILLLLPAVGLDFEYRPETGTFVKDTFRTGLGALTIINDNPMSDAVTVLNKRDEEAVLAVFIRSNTSFTISGIEDGSYDVYFEFGNTWNISTNRFTDVDGFYRLDRPLQFKTTERYEGLEYSVWTVALETALPEANEAGRTVLVDEGEFPDLKPL